MTGEEARDLKHHMLWDALCQEIDLKIEAVKDRLISCAPTELVKCQEEIKALKSLKSMPQDVIDRET